MTKKFAEDENFIKYAEYINIDKKIKKYPCPIIVVGPDNFWEEDYIASEISSLIDFYWSHGFSYKDMCVISSGRKGAEIVAEKVAKDFGINVVRFDPNYDKLGRKIGTKINHIKMCKYCFKAAKNKKLGQVVVFYDGLSARLQHMIEAARMSKLNVRIVQVRRSV